MRNENSCQRCGQGNDPDTRYLWMACFYEMDELGIPYLVSISRLISHDTIFGHLKLPINKHHEGQPYESSEKRFYTLEVCKDCRGEWMNAIKTWFNEKSAPKSCGSGIFVRRNGATVEITDTLKRMEAEKEALESARLAIKDLLWITSCMADCRESKDGLIHGPRCKRKAGFEFIKHLESIKGNE